MYAGAYIGSFGVHVGFYVDDVRIWTVGRTESRNQQEVAGLHRYFSACRKRGSCTGPLRPAMPGNDQYRD